MINKTTIAKAIRVKVDPKNSRKPQKIRKIRKYHRREELDRKIAYKRKVILNSND